MRLLLALLVISALTAAFADETAELWSIQTVAFRDFREATDAAYLLSSEGFDAYTEFTMHEGLQFVRVRVGCFTSRDAAEVMAWSMAGTASPEAAVVEFSPDAPAAGCVTMDVGFLKSVDWSATTTTNGVPAYQVSVAGHEAHIAYTGNRWRVVQEGTNIPPQDPGLATVSFRERTVAGVTYVSTVVAGHDLILCPGHLLDEIGDVVIAERDDALVACRLGPLGPS